MDLLLIEGLPGSGKSTLAKQLYDGAQVDGVGSSWYLEESADHPIHPAFIKHDKYKKTFPELCLKQWAKFVSDNKGSDHLFIFEGSLFQSTVRFMLEGRNQKLVADYYSECQRILADVNPKLIYLRPSNVESHIEWVMEHRGEKWSLKVAEYLEKTPYCFEQQWNGKECMVSFWSNYAQLCDLLIEQTRMPYQTINAGNGYFDSQYSEELKRLYVPGHQ
ncbi:hypothetical protein QWZ13_15745 [Reinekea marina]|uniref:Uncharacterized protein n=1 Tax=Reinekea marina TaxID=1310421 RepID=A0ABV7WSF5_9GAMM|nr:hypothetical protein [Reinekea marina]MDN3650360.1 hypothetical protein [Reinekea marina]